MPTCSGYGQDFAISSCAFTHIITSEDFANAFPMSFPDMDDPTQKKQWEKAWDNQKDEAGRNNVDKVEYWDKLFV